MKVGILGYGYMGTIRHRVLEARSDVEVAAVFHTDASAPRHVARWQDVVDDPAIEAVIVCLPNHLLAEATLRALAAGKHVLAEKPPGISARQARAMRDARGTRVLQFGFNLRHHPAIRRVRSLVASGELGGLVWMRGVYGKPMAPDFAAGWRADPASAGGGILLDQGIHLLDVMQLLGGPFDDVFAVAATREGARVEDDVMIAMRAATGAIASLHSSHRQSPPRFSLEVGFAGGAAHLEGLLTRTGRYGPERIAWGPPDAPRANEEVFASDDSWAREIDAFVTAIRDGRTPADGSADQAVALMELVERVYRAAGLAPR